MMRVPWSVSCLVTVMIMTFVVPQLMLAEEDPEVGTIVGEIDVASEDDEGNVTGVWIYDGEWGSVLVASTGKGRELLTHVGATVEATGILTELGEEDDFDYQIQIQSYKLLED
jgi:hypothetical protein